MNILLIEDHPYKQGKILAFLTETFPEATVVTRNSYNSGLRELVNNNSVYDLVLLDISMPIYDISPEENGGEFLPMAGKLILKEMFLREIPTKAIVVTMHGSFEDGTRLDQLHKALLREFKDNYAGHVYFAPTSTEWKNQLENLIKKLDK